MYRIVTHTRTLARAALCPLAVRFVRCSSASPLVASNENAALQRLQRFIGTTTAATEFSGGADGFISVLDAQRFATAEAALAKKDVEVELALAKKDAELAKKDAELALAKKDAEKKDVEVALAKKDVEVALAKKDVEVALAKKDVELAKKDVEVAKKDAELALAQKDAEMKDVEVELVKKDGELRLQHKNTAARAQRADVMRGVLSIRALLEALARKMAPHVGLPSTASVTDVLARLFAPAKASHCLGFHAYLEVCAADNHVALDQLLRDGKDLFNVLSRPMHSGHSSHPPERLDSEVLHGQKSGLLALAALAAFNGRDLQLYEDGTIVLAPSSGAMRIRVAPASACAATKQEVESLPFS